MLKLLSTENSVRSFSFFGFIVALLYNNHSEDLMYDLPLLKLTL